MKKIKVALLIDEFFGGANTAYGGYGFLARNYICKYIPSKYIQIDVLLEQKDNLSSVEFEYVDKVRVYRLPSDPNLAAAWLNRQNYALFMSIELTYPSFLIMRLVSNKKLLLWVQDPRPNNVWQKVRNSMSIIKDPCVVDKQIPLFVKRLQDQNRIKFISQGETLVSLANELYHTNDQVKMDIVRNPIELDLNFNLDLSKKKKQVIFLGRLEAQKRVWLVCELAKLLPCYDFIVMGKFFRDEEENREILNKYINHPFSNLHFVGHIEGKQKEDIIKESRLLINTSIWEGIPISWLECLQYGTLIVSCLNNEDLPNRFGKYVGNILGDGFKDVYKFVPAINELMQNDQLYLNLSKKAIDYVREYHNIEIFKQKIRNLIVKNAELNFYQKLFNKFFDLTK